MCTVTDFEINGKLKESGKGSFSLFRDWNSKDHCLELNDGQKCRPATRQNVNSTECDQG
jgi:hypothetical protein